MQFWENQGYVAERIEKMTKDEDKKYSEMHGWLYKVDVESTSEEKVQEEVYKRLREQMNAAKGGSMLADVDDDVLSDETKEAFAGPYSRALEGTAQHGETMVLKNTAQHNLFVNKTCGRSQTRQFVLAKQNDAFLPNTRVRSFQRIEGVFSMQDIRGLWEN